MFEKQKTGVLSTIPSTCVFTTKFLEPVLQPVTKESGCGVCLPLPSPASAQNFLLTGLTSRGALTLRGGPLSHHPSPSFTHSRTCLSPSSNQYQEKGKF